jgi:hypothetical protein
MTMTKQELVEAFLSGDMGDVEFMELAMDLEMDFRAIERVLQEAREEL